MNCGLFIAPSLMTVTSSSSSLGSSDGDELSTSMRWQEQLNKSSKIMMYGAQLTSRARRRADRWRLAALGEIIRQCRRGPEQARKCASRDIYQFGVYTGTSMRLIAHTLKEAGVGFRRMWGFDSFQGLPAEPPNGNSAEQLARYGFYEGTWSVAEALKLHSLVAQLEVYINDNRTEWVRGYWSNKTLTASLVRQREMAQALYVDIDCDLHSSTASALRWLFEQQRAVEGTLVGYDDWATEQRAHFEAFAFYGVNSTHVNVGPANRAFLIQGVGTIATQSLAPEF